MKTLDDWLEEFEEEFYLESGYFRKVNGYSKIKDFLSSMYREVREELIAKLQEENRQRSIAIWCEDDSSEHKDGYAKRCNELQQIMNNL